MRNLQRPAYLLVLASFLALTSACGDDTETGGGGQGPAGGGGSGEGGATGGGGEGQGGTPDIPLYSKVISTSNNTFYEAETSVVATSTGRVVAAWIGATFSGHTVIGYATSEDDGATFSAPQFVENTTGIEQGDPVLAELPGGTVILTWLGYDYDNTGNTTNMHTFTALLEDGSPSFDNVVIASDPLDDPYLLDKPWIAVTDDGSIVLTYAHINQQGDSTLVSSFSDDGLTWSQANVFPESANHFYNLAYVCSAVGAGRMHAAVLDFSNFGVKLVAPFLWTPEKGARTSVKIASSSEVEGVTGKYYDERSRERPSSVTSHDVALQETLWKTSAELAGEPLEPTFA